MRGAAFLEKALSGEPITWQDIDELRTRRVREDQWLEYKRGAWILGNPAKQSRPGQPTKGADRLRKWVYGFANAEGGVLIIGMAGHEPQSAKDADGDELSASQPFEVDGCPEINPARREWAARNLRDLVAHLPSPFECQEVETPSGKTLLVVAVPRAVTLAACVEHGERVHYLRNGDETRPMSTGLYTDLVLGRRQRPSFSLRVEELGNRQSIDFRVHIENEGLSAVPRAVYALLTPMASNQLRPLTAGLRRLVELGQCSWGWVPRARIDIANGPLPPFESTAYGLSIAYPQHESIALVTIEAVVVIAPEGDTPRLIQVAARLEPGDTPLCEFRELPPGELGRVSLEVVKM